MVDYWLNKLQCPFSKFRLRLGFPVDGRSHYLIAKLLVFRRHTQGGHLKSLLGNCCMSWPTDVFSMWLFINTFRSGLIVAGWVMQCARILIRFGHDAGKVNNVDRQVAQIFLDSGTSIRHMCMVFKLSIYFYIVLMKVKHCPKYRASCLTTIFTMRVHFRCWVSISHKPNGATRAPPF